MEHTEAWSDLQQDWIIIDFEEMNKLNLNEIEIDEQPLPF
jgi:hypothetical protein